MNKSLELLNSRKHNEFFAGIGGVKIGLSKNWETLFANDIDPQKKETYLSNCNKNEITHYIVKDIRELKSSEIPDAGLASATFPCTNTSCAGNRAGLLGMKSGVIYNYLSKVEQKGGAESTPLSLLENPTGLIARNQGNDLRDLTIKLNSLGYSVAMLVVDAKHFVPQSRPRIFIIPIKRSLAHDIRPIKSASDIPSDKDLYPNPLRKWLTTNSDLDLVVPDTPLLPTRTKQLTDVIDIDDTDSKSWAAPSFEQELIRLMTDKNKLVFEKMIRSPEMIIATVARRGRKRTDGSGFNSTELSLSGISPCMRPYKGGSSRAWVLIAGKGKYRFKVISPRESARLMGFNDDFILPSSIKSAYQATGDAVVPQAVAWVDTHILQPLIKRANLYPDV